MEYYNFNNLIKQTHFPNTPVCVYTKILKETHQQSWVDYLQIVIRYWFQITWQKKMSVT